MTARFGSFRIGSIARWLGYCISVGLALLACSSTQSDSGVSERLGSSFAPVIGNASFPTGLWQSVGVYTNYATSCSGTVIGPYYFLTAAHCLGRNFSTDPTPTVILYDAAGNVTQSTPAVQALPSLNGETAVVVTRDLLQAEPIRVYEYPLDSTWLNRKIFAMGFGGHSQNTFYGGWATIQSFSSPVPSEYNAGGASDGVTVCPGDSGGPDLAFLEGQWYVVGVHHAGSPCNQNPLVTYSSARVDWTGPWLRSVAAVRDNTSFRSDLHDGLKRNGFVNPDTRSDFIVTTATGTQLYLSNAGGSGFTQVAISSQIPSGSTAMPTVCYQGTCQAQSTLPSTIGGLVLGQIEAGLGDFDGDGHDDLVAVTPKGLGIWSAQGPNFTSFAVTPYFWTAGLQVGYGDYAIASFDGSAQKQLLIRYVNGTVLWKFPSANTVVQLFGLDPTIYNARSVVVGPVWTSSLQTGVIFQTSYNASLWQSDGTGNLVNRCNWSSGNASDAEYYPGHFLAGNGNQVLEVTASGTRLFSFLSSGCLASSPIWTRTDLVANQTGYLVTDFTGDGLDDLLITNQGGTYEYVATGNVFSPFSASTFSRTDLPITANDYSSGDFDGDGAMDLWISTGGGSYGYLGQHAGGFLANQWSRPDFVYRRFVNH